MRVANDTFVIFQFEQANVPVVILQRLQLEFGDVLGAQGETVVAAFLFHVLFETRFLVFKKRRVPQRAFAVGPALGVHLEQAQIDAQLHFLMPVASCETAHHNLAGLIIPILEELRDVEIHRGGVWRARQASQRASRVFAFRSSPRFAMLREMDLLPEDIVLQHVHAALAEDVGSGDVTTLATVPENATARAVMVAREKLVVSGLQLAEVAFQTVVPALRIELLVNDGTRVQPGATLLRAEGPARSLLTAERVALNFVQRLSGVATLAERFVEAVAGTRAVILDTRKTTPGWRELEKYAVRCGGARNHRFGLWDMVLIKDNHLAALRDARPNAIAAAVQRAREKYPSLKVEVEADTLVQVEQAVAAGADIVLLDNMSLDQLREAVRIVSGRAKTEASGGVNLQTVRGIAETGVDFISVGAMTHSARAVDIGLDFV
jgi:nicotinate-nucleotide pyrophosphorylase (carboxylating)